MIVQCLTLLPLEIEKYLGKCISVRPHRHIKTILLVVKLWVPTHGRVVSKLTFFSGALGSNNEYLNDDGLKYGAIKCDVSST